MNFLRYISVLLLLLNLGCGGDPSPDPGQQPVVLMANIGLPAEVYDLIKDDGGADQHTADKNEVIPLIKDAIDRKDSKRDIDITNYLAGKAHFVDSRLAARIIALLPPLGSGPAPVLMAKPPEVPKKIYDAITLVAGATIVEKNKAIKDIDAAFKAATDKSHEAKRNTQVENALTGNLASIRPTVIGMLPDLIILRSVDFDPLIYDKILKVAGATDAEKNKAIKGIETILKGATEKAHEAKRYQLVGAMLKGSLAGIKDDVVGMLPDLPDETPIKLQPKNVPEDIYKAIIDEGGVTNLDKNKAIEAIDDALGRATDKSHEDERLRAVGNALKGSLARIKGDVVSKLPELLSTRPHKLQLAIYDKIKADGTATIAQKNTALAAIDKALNLAQTDAERNEAIKDAVKGSPASIKDAVVGMLAPPAKKTTTTASGKASGSMKVEFIKASHINKEMFDALKQFLLENFDIEDAKSSDVKIMLSTAIAARLEHYIDDKIEELRQGKMAVVFLQRAGKGIRPETLTDPKFVYSAAKILQAGSSSKDISLQTPDSAGQEFSKDFCKMLEGVAKEVGLTGTCKAKSGKNPYQEPL